MSSDAEDRTTIRKYLLGEITGEDELREIEESLFTDEEYYEELLRVEAELADQYVGGELTAGEREKVEKLFLPSPGRSRDISFALAVKELLAKRSGGTGGGGTGNSAGSAGEPTSPRDNVRKFPDGKRILSSAQFRIAASVIILFALGAGVWRTFLYRSDIDRGLVALKEAYKDQRPTEARISVLDYARPPNQRGGPDRVNNDARGRAGRLLQYAVEDAPSAVSYHALGDHLLAAGHFDEALAQFAKASELDPNDAELQNDIGVALLEKAKAASPADAEVGKGLIDAGTSLAHFERALELDGSLLDALFNRPLALESLKDFEQAREAWTKYLERDSHSEWAGEARHHIDRLRERRQDKKSQTKEQVRNDFLAAYRLKDDSRAWQVISRNREVIEGKFVSSQLIYAYIDAALGGRDDDARELLQALDYAGKLESKNVGDNYTSELALFYRSLPRVRLPALSRAHELMRQGYDWCQEAKFGRAAESFEEAKETFESAGDELEVYADEYWIAYCHHQLARGEEGLAVLRPLIQVCKERGYKWLLAQALNSSANIQSALKNYSEGIAETEQSLALSVQLGDSYTTQKNLAQQADKYRKLGRQPEMLKYLRRCLEQSEASWPGVRQMWRNYDTAANAFQAFGLHAAALAYRREAFSLSVDEQDPSTIYVSLIHLALAYSQLRKHEEAIELARQGLAIGQNLPDPVVGQKITAYCALQLGHLYRQSNDLGKAVESYEQAIQTYNNLQFQPFSYDAHKGKLLCHLALGDDDASERGLRTALQLVEENRKKIREEENRNNYYDAEQGIYDLAVDFAYTKLSDPKRAFEYSETSRARSLLDLMQGLSRGAGDGEESINVEAISQSLMLEEIQRRMPERAQILHYTILPDKVIIWFIRRNEFKHGETRIAADELEKLIRRYLGLISAPPDGRDAEARDAAAALYKVLIEPVEPLLHKEELLCVVPDKLLNHLPFDALVSPATGKYLIADYPLSHSPSSSVFVEGSKTAQDRAAVVAPETLLSVGVPIFDRKAFPRLPDLPAAAKEASEVGESYDVKTSLIGPDATKENVTRQMKDADVVHFATHYVVDEDSPMSSKLLLAKSSGAGESGGANGVLRVYDLYGMRLRRTRLVVLAACRTGVERYYKGEGMIGMSRAFIAAGVPTVVASQWPVDSDATAELMVNFHRHRRQGRLTNAEALRAAQSYMLNQQGQRYQHPYYWAAFVIIGGHDPS